MTPLIYRYFTDHRNMMRRFWGLGGHYGKGKDGEETRLISKWYVDPFSSLLAKQKSRDLFLWGIIRIISIKLKQQKAQNMLLSFLSFFGHDGAWAQGHGHAVQFYCITELCLQPKTFFLETEKDISM